VSTSPLGSSPGPAEQVPIGTQAVSIPEAAAQLGVSINTVRRMIARGELQAERVHRPQGYTWQVHLPTVGTHEVPEQVQVPHGAGAQVPALVPIEQQRAEALAVYGATLLAPVLATVERLEQANRAQAQTIGRLEAELATARAPLPAGADCANAQTPRPPWWRRLAWWR
jgi:excisionase family DNA binding protein